MAQGMQVGNLAPDFELASSTGEKVKLSQYRGKKNVVLFFYPKDETAGCTAEACSFRDTYEEFLDAGAEVLGISGDSLDSHRRFKGKHGLPMQLLSDRGNRVRKAFGIKSNWIVVPGRVTYVVDKKGIIRHIFDSQVLAIKHVSEALDMIKKLEKEAA